MKKATFLGVLSLLLLSMPSIWAQSPAAQVSGQIRDASGAVIPGVLLEAHDQENGRVSSALTDEEGRYEFLRLAPGKYGLGFNSTLGGPVQKFVGPEALIALPARGNHWEQVLYHLKHLSILGSSFSGTCAP